MVRLVKFIPNLFTLGNLFCGLLAIIAIGKDQYLTTIFLVLGGAFLDFFDGMLARLLKVSGPLGKELDSLADMVTFGVVPGFILFHFFKESTTSIYLPYLGFLITLASAYRLANFNISTNQSDGFIGVPTPANTLFFLSFCLIQHFQLEAFYFFFSPIFIISVTLIFSYLLNAKIPMIALKFKHYRWKENEFKWITIILTLILILSFKMASLPFVIIGYILLSVIQNLTTNKT